MHPAGVAPGQQLEALGFQDGLEPRPETLSDVVELGIGAEHHRHLQGLDLGRDLGQAGARQGGGMELPDPHLPDHVGLVAGDAAGVDADPDVRPGRRLPSLGSS